jgi:hypothetical protein
VLGSVLGWHCWPRWPLPPCRRPANSPGCPGPCSTRKRRCTSSKWRPKRRPSSAP